MYVPPTLDLLYRLSPFVLSSVHTDNPPSLCLFSVYYFDCNRTLSSAGFFPPSCHSLGKLGGQCHPARFHMCGMLGKWICC